MQSKFTYKIMQIREVYFASHTYFCMHHRSAWFPLDTADGTSRPPLRWVSRSWGI